MSWAFVLNVGFATGQRYAADANRRKPTPKADWNPEAIDPDSAPRAVRAYFDTLDDAAFGAASPVVPKFISHSDLASQWADARGGPAYVAYSTNYLIDTGNAVILDVEPRRSIRQAEVEAVRTMIDRVRNTHDINLNASLQARLMLTQHFFANAALLSWQCSTFSQTCRLHSR